MARQATYHGKPLLANHQKSWLWGTIPIWETLKQGSWPIYELRISQTADQPIHEQCLARADELGVPVIQESADRLEELCKAKDHQGVIALMGPFPYADSTTFFKNSQPADVILVLDQIQDPYNMGAMIRSAFAFGVRGLLIGKEQQVGVTSHVARSSAGLVNQLTICQVNQLKMTLQEIRKTHQILITQQSGQLPLQQVRQTSPYDHSPLVIVIGNEAHGVSQEIEQLAHASVSIPMQPNAESLNAAIAASVIMYELNRKA